ncbi:hypothetical protein AMTR_s02313p00009380, partial [Amborella trichopoda]
TKGDIAPCKEVLREVRKEILENMDAEKGKKEEKEESIVELREGVNIYGDNGSDDDDDGGEIK